MISLAQYSSRDVHADDPTLHAGNHTQNEGKDRKRDGHAIYDPATGQIPYPAMWPGSV